MASLAEMRARLQQLNQRTGKGKNDIFKAKDEHDLRLLPNPEGGDPFEILIFHYELGGASCLCPRQFGKKCKVCDFCDKLKAWKDPATGQDKPEMERKADFEIFKKIQPTEKALCRVVEVMKDGTLSADGPKWWSPGFTNNNKILEYCSNPDRQAAVGLEEGSDKGLDVLFSTGKSYNIHVSFKAKAGQPNSKGNKKNRDITEITDLSVNPKPLSKDKKEIERVLAACKNIREVYPEQSPEDVAVILDKFIGQGGEEAAPVGGTEKYEANTGENAGVKGGKTIDQAFGETLATE